MTTETEVKTANVQNRRKLHFETLDDLLEDARSMANQETRCLGNWSEAQIFDHLAIALNAAIDGVDFKPPFFFKVIGPFLKGWMINSPMKPGFRIKGEGEKFFRPDPNLSKQEAFAKLESAVKRCQETDERAPNVVLGKWTTDEANKFHLRHAEMHLSFIVPANQFTS